MKAVIMAGGQGTRLRPVTLTRPKPLVPVAGEACIDYVIKSLQDAGVTDIIITTGFRAGEIVLHTGGGSRYGDLNITFSIEDTPMGTAGGVKKMENFLDDTFIVASGDGVSDVDIASLLKFHKERKADATMALTTVDNPTQFGIVGIDDEGRIQRFKEKPAPEEVFSNLINAGIYILEPHVLNLIPNGKKYDFSKQLFPDMLDRGLRLFAQPITGLWKDIGDPFDLIDTNMLMIQRKGGFLSNSEKDDWKGVEVKEPCMIGDGTVVTPGSSLHEVALYTNVRIERSDLSDCVVLDGARMGEGCKIFHSFIGKNVTVGKGSVIEKSVIGDDQIIPEGSRINGERIPGS